MQSALPHCSKQQLRSNHVTHRPARVRRLERIAGNQTQHGHAGIQQQAAAEQANVAKLDALIDIGKQLVQEAAKNEEFDPDQLENPAVCARFGEVLTKMGRLDEARPWIEKSLRRGKTPLDRPRRWAVPPDLRHLRPK